MHGSLGFMVNNHPTLRAELKDKDDYCKPVYVRHIPAKLDTI